MNNQGNSNIIYKNNEEKLYSLLQSIPDLLFLFTPDGKIIAYHSTNYDRLFLPPEKIIGANLRDIPIEKKYIDEIFLAVEETIKTGEVILVNYSFVFNDQTSYYEARIIANNQNEIFAIIKEITDLVEIEKSFYKNLDVYQENYSTITESIIIINERDEITFWNDAASDTFNVTKENAIGKNIYSIIQSQEFKKKFENFIEIIQKNQFNDDITDEFEINILNNKNITSQLIFNLSKVRLSEKQHILIMVKNLTNINLLQNKFNQKINDNQKFSNALTKLFNLNNDNFDELLNNALSIDCNTLNIERVGLWLLNEDNSLLVNKATWVNSKQKIIYEDSCEISKIKCYFDYFSSNRIIATESIIEEERFDCIEDYLNKNYIFSKLDATIKISGKITGILTHEHINTKKFWTQQEIEFASSVAEMISLHLEANLRKNTEQKLKEANEIIEKVFELSPFGIIIVNSNGKLASINEKVFEFFNIPNELYTNKQYDEISQIIREQVGNTKFESNNPMKYALDKRTDIIYDSIETKYGKQFECYISPMINKDNIYSGAVLFLEDVTKYTKFQ
ncbi:MAG TPA: PAS domain-containing protein [Candidatus Kapabacteria bacterium]|nr:PAS domain-containing protein [Candidatus Kapabacteria bacterium]